jgi:hypothetical protein
MIDDHLAPRASIIIEPEVSIALGPKYLLSATWRSVEPTDQTDKEL